MSYEMRFCEPIERKREGKDDYLMEDNDNNALPLLATGETFLASPVPGGRNGRKIISMAGCLPTTKRFRHGRPDRGR
jgi:hypothetical protein